MDLARMLFALTVFFLAACSAPVEDTHPGQPVKTRQEAFKDILRSFEPMGKMMRGDRYDAEKFLALAQELKTKREVPWSLFGADTNYPPTKAKDAVWSDAEGFDRARKDFFAATDTLIAVAQTKNRELIEKAYFAAYDSCEGCHKQYKRK